MSDFDETMTLTKHDALIKNRCMCPVILSEGWRQALREFLAEEGYVKATEGHCPNCAEHGFTVIHHAKPKSETGGMQAENPPLHSYRCKSCRVVIVTEKPPIDYICKTCQAKAENPIGVVQYAAMMREQAEANVGNGRAISPIHDEEAIAAASDAISGIIDDPENYYTTKRWADRIIRDLSSPIDYKCQVRRWSELAVKYLDELGYHRHLDKPEAQAEAE